MADDILKRVGVVLLIVGLIDIGVMIYCIMNDVSYSSSFNVFAVALGILLMRGSLRAASIVRFFGAFFLASIIALVAAWPFLQPLGLTLAELRHAAPLDIARYLAFALFVVALLFWTTLELSQEAVLAALRASGHSARALYMPSALGIGLVVAIGVGLVFLTGGETGTRAINLAAQRLGPSYSYHVSSLHVTKTNQGTSVFGIVTAWNDVDIRNVPVAWKER